jgi:hypothetical protein
MISQSNLLALCRQGCKAICRHWALAARSSSSSNKAQGALQSLYDWVT